LSLAWSSFPICRWWIARSASRQERPSAADPPPRAFSGATTDYEREPVSGALSLAGFNQLVHDWLAEDAERVRLVSGVLIRLDELAALTPPVGEFVRDHCLTGTGRLLLSLVRQERGFDRVARLDRESYMLFLGDTGLRNATSAAERIRQTIAAARFLDGERSISLTVSCAVGEWSASEPASNWVDGLRAALEQARAEGQNQSWTASAAGCARVVSQAYRVPIKEIPLPGALTIAMETPCAAD
jgi:GGDEF domain-containing protein